MHWQSTFLLLPWSFREDPPNRRVCSLFLIFLILIHVNVLDTASVRTTLFGIVLFESLEIIYHYNWSDSISRYLHNNIFVTIILPKIWDTELVRKISFFLLNTLLKCQICSILTRDDLRKGYSNHTLILLPILTYNNKSSCGKVMRNLFVQFW